MSSIPVDRLNQNARKLSIRRFGIGEEPSAHEQTGVHRDDHYIFFLFEEGTANMMIDFEELSFQSRQVFYILPGQVHTRINNRQANGWFLALDTQFIPVAQRAILEDTLVLQQPTTMCAEVFDQCRALLNIIQQRSAAKPMQHVDQEVLRNLLQAFTGILAGMYNVADVAGLKVSRKQQLTSEFKGLLRSHFKEIKRPSAYAKLLNVSENYLNEAIRKHTGFSITYWIRRELILEAKRLLYYTSLDVKEIAHGLGYEDHTYFFKLFKKEVGASPLAFRNKNME